MQIEVIGPRTGKYTGNLLSAAPDLLTALRNMVVCFEANDYDSMANAVLDARAAIAKAEGKQP